MPSPANPRPRAPLARAPAWMALLGALALAFSTTLVSAQAQAQAQTASPTTAPAKPRQFVYVLRVAPALHDAGRWTAADNAAVGRHFARLAAATKAGQVIFAGKTSEPLDSTFGLVVFEADNETAARQFMADDPAVVAGVMTATLHPYALVLQRPASAAASGRANPPTSTP